MHKLQYDVDHPTKLTLPTGFSEGDANGEYLTPQMCPTLLSPGELLPFGPPPLASTVIAAPVTPQRIRLFRYHLSLASIAGGAGANCGLRVRWIGAGLVFHHLFCDLALPTSRDVSIDFSPYGIEGPIATGLEVAIWGATFYVAYNFMYSLSI